MCWFYVPEKHFKSTLICLAVFFTCCVPSAQSSQEPFCFTSACPGTFRSGTAGPAWPARPVAFLDNIRSCTCKTLYIVKLTCKRLKIKTWIECWDTLTWVLSLICFVILAGQAFKLVRTHAYTLSIQESESSATVTGLTLAHIILCHVVLHGLFQVGYLGVCSWHIQWNYHVDWLRLKETPFFLVSLTIYWMNQFHNIHFHLPHILEWTLTLC